VTTAKVRSLLDGAGMLLLCALSRHLTVSAKLAPRHLPTHGRRRAVPKTTYRSLQGGAGGRPRILRLTSSERNARWQALYIVVNA
jgi:hypothetical protein